MKLIPLPPETRREFNATHKAIIDYTDVAALGAGTTGTVNLFTAYSGYRVEVLAVYLVTAFDFSDASMNSLAATIGDGGSATRLLASSELAVDGTEINWANGAGNYLYSGAGLGVPVGVYFTGAGGASPTLAECTSGQVEIYLSIVQFDNLTRVK